MVLHRHGLKPPEYCLQTLQVLADPHGVRCELLVRRPGKSEQGELHLAPRAVRDPPHRHVDLVARCRAQPVIDHAELIVRGAVDHRRFGDRVDHPAAREPMCRAVERRRPAGQDRRIVDVVEDLLRQAVHADGQDHGFVGRTHDPDCTTGVFRHGPEAPAAPLRGTP